MQISKLIWPIRNLINSTRNNPHRQTVAVNQTDVVPRVLGRRLRREVELDFGVGRRLAAEGRTRRRRLAELAVVAGIGAVNLRPESAGPTIVRDLNLKCALLSFKCVCPKLKKVATQNAKLYQEITKKVNSNHIIEKWNNTQC